LRLDCAEVWLHCIAQKHGKVVGFYRDFVVLKMEAGSGKVGVTKAMLKSWGNDVKAK
jgi:hypothetical protein